MVLVCPILYLCLRESSSLRLADPLIRIFRGSAVVLVCSYAAKQWSFSLRVDCGSDPRGSAYRLPPARLLTSHHRMRREQPVLDLHRPVSNLCGDLWPSLQGPG